MNGDLNSWDKFCNYLWFDKNLNIWLDISKINFTIKEIKKTLNFNCLYSKTYFSKTYLFDDNNLNKFK